MPDAHPADRIEDLSKEALLKLVPDYMHHCHGIPFERRGSFEHLLLSSKCF